MLISIIIPLYNKEKSIKTTIQSILDQTYTLFEAVVIDDGSTDNSAQIVNEINDNRIKYHKKNNGGVSSARNKGIELATGDWLMFLDADDTLYPNALDCLVNLKEKHPNYNVYSANFKICYLNESFSYTNKPLNYNIINNPFKEQLLNKWNIRLGSFIVSSKKLETIRFNVNSTLGEDVLFVDAILENPIIYSNTVILSYNKEYSELSTKRVQIEKCYSWHNSIVHYSFYKILINSINLLKALYIHFSTGQYQNFLKLFVRKSVYYPVVVLSLIIYPIVLICHRISK